MEIMRIGLDLAKNVFEAFGVDRQENEQLRKILKRNKALEYFSQFEPCIVGIETCVCPFRFWGMVGPCVRFDLGLYRLVCA